jgi:hypothetical protein
LLRSGVHELERTQLDPQALYPHASSVLDAIRAIKSEEHAILPPKAKSYGISDEEVVRRKIAVREVSNY